MTGGLHIHQEFWYNAGDAAAMRENAAGDGAHDAFRAAAIDEAKMIFGDGFAKNPAGFHEGRIAPRLGAAIDADGSNRGILLTHGIKRHRGAACVKKNEGNRAFRRSEHAVMLVENLGNR